MSHLYQYDDLTAAPSLGMLRAYVEESSMAQTSFADISYHPEEKWLKIWFAEALSAEDKLTLDGFVNDSLGVKKFQDETGSVYFELIPTQGKRWERHRRRISFQTAFNSVPAVSVSGANFDGTANLEILDVTERHFDFRVTAVNGRGSVRGLTTVEFDWEAKAWQA